MNVNIIALIFQVVTAPGYEDKTRNFTLDSGSCVADDLSDLHVALRIQIKMLPKSPRVPVPFSISSDSDPPPNNRVFYPDQVNPFQEETPKRHQAKTKHTISKSRTNSRIPSNRPGVFDNSRSTLGKFARNTTPQTPRKRRRRRRRPGILSTRNAFYDSTDSTDHIGLRNDNDDYEYYGSDVDGIERC